MSGNTGHLHAWTVFENKGDVNSFSVPFVDAPALPDHLPITTTEFLHLSLTDRCETAAFIDIKHTDSANGAHHQKPDPIPLRSRSRAAYSRIE